MTFPSPTNLLFDLQNLTKSYGPRQVLNVESLQIFRGEVFALIGPSGAGKSTLLRLLNFLETPTAGQLTYKDFTLNGSLPPAKLQRTITTVFQRSLLLDRSVADNVSFGLRVRGQSRRGARDSVAALLEQVGLTHLADAPARSLSGGEIQRVALARALAINPTVLLLDEPTANLDPSNVAIIEKIITTVNQTRQTTMILVTHNIFQARRLANRTALILDGQVVEVGPTAQLFENPQDPRTTAFLRGDMVY